MRFGGPNRQKQGFLNGFGRSNDDQVEKLITNSGALVPTKKAWLSPEIEVGSEKEYCATCPDLLSLK
jgi:hypothetical protein